MLADCLFNISMWADCNVAEDSEPIITNHVCMVVCGCKALSVESMLDPPPLTHVISHI